MIAWEFGMLLADKLIGPIVPVRFALFAMIGAFGLLVHLAMLWISLRLVGLGFAPAQSVATIVAMTSNFFFNNQFTYRDQRLSGLPL
jgi:dolichol-phosphate mannosyltransferase